LLFKERSSLSDVALR